MHETQLSQTAPAGAAALAGLEWPIERVIAPVKRRLTLRDLIRERSVIRVLAARDFKIKYKQSLLGPIWLVFQPLALLCAFLVAFRNLTNVHSSGVPYTVFTLVGLSAWSYFQASMTIGTASLITNYSFVRFTPCPRPAFPIAALIASLPSFAVTASGAIVAAAISGHLSPRIVLLPLGLAWLLLLTSGTVGIFSALTVRYRDITSAMPFLLQVGVFLAPIGYTLAQLSSGVRALVELNPITGVIEAWRWMLLSGYHPSLAPIVISLVLTVLLSVAGWRIFSRVETTMADEI
jgi:ABC-type polysaccharide/polyol phosphate export permease